MSETSGLKIELSGSQAKLTGVLDENASLAPLEKLSGSVTISFQGVERVNSCGVRDWVELLKKLSGCQITYSECSPVIVKQLNAVPDFAGSAKIESFFAPYFCEATDSEVMVLLKPSDVLSGQPPERKSANGETLTFDEIAAKYFSFLSR